MTEIRTKDKIFVALALPLAAAAFYFLQWRPQLVKKLDGLQARDRVTVMPENFQRAKTEKARIAEAADRELEKERAIPLPASETVGDAADSPARRTQSVVAVFRAAGARVVSSGLADDAPDAAVVGTLRATGTRPAPIARIYLVEADYRALCNALRRFEEEKLPVIASALSSEGGNRWRLKIYE